jgi:diguanylate cyclase (GGDEF)-like protein
MQNSEAWWLTALAAAVGILLTYAVLTLGRRATKTERHRILAWFGGSAALIGLVMLALPSRESQIENGSVVAAYLFLSVLCSLCCLALLSRWLGQRDATYLSDAGAALECEAGFDAVTCLPNRAASNRSLQRAMRRASRRRMRLALLVLNVDRLKSVNESLGHQCGDRLLREYGQRLRRVLRGRDAIMRLAGDEFVIIADDLKDAQQAEPIAQKVLAALSPPFAVGGMELRSSATVGISVYPNDGDTPDALLRHAGAAMRYAKDVERGGYRFYAPQMASGRDDRLTLENELWQALAFNQFELHYQPKVDIATGRVRSAEALVRWRHPQRGLIMPPSFIALAEESGVIVPLGEWVVREACRQMRAWLDTDGFSVRIAVNLAAKQFRHTDLVSIVRSALADYRLQPGYLELELTESAIMHDPDQSVETLKALSAMGVHISIDDFGTGYSSLSYLRRFPLDKLKIDRSFIGELMSNSDAAAIVTAIISLAHSLRLRVVAEGVETEAQLERLRELRCDQYQGYLCSPAVSAEHFIELMTMLRQNRGELTEADMLRTHSRLSAFVA